MSVSGPGTNVLTDDPGCASPRRSTAAVGSRIRTVKIQNIGMTGAKKTLFAPTGRGDSGAMSESRRCPSLAAEAIAAPLSVGALLIPLRGHLDAANGALILVVTVVAVAARGQRWAAALAALVAAASFDFFFTRPFYSLRITSRDDLITELLLLVVGLAVGDLAARGRAHRSQAVERGEQVDRMHAVTELVAEGESSEFVTVVAATELRDLLHLRDCRFTGSAAATGATHITPNGGVLIGTVPWSTARFGLPTNEVDLPVRNHGLVLGHFLLTPTPTYPVTDERLRVAVAIADQVGAALSGDPARSA